MNKVKIRARIAGAMLIIITILIIIISIELFVRTPKGVSVEIINDATYNVIEIEGMTCISGATSLTCNWDEWDKRE